VEESYLEAERHFSEINNELHIFLPEFYDGYACEKLVGLLELL
jgi:hypothetical protein